MKKTVRSSISPRSFIQLNKPGNTLLLCVISFFGFFFASSLVYKFFYTGGFYQIAQARGISAPLATREIRIESSSLRGLAKSRESLLAGNMIPRELYSKLMYSKEAIPSFEMSTGEKIQIGWDIELQNKTQILLDKMNITWGSLVALDPRTGKILALASRQGDSKGPLALRASFPAASIFKVITASAAIESKGLNEYSVISFRGGNYTLNKFNYDVSSKSDTRRMLLGEAFGKSCNPVFGRLALGYIGAKRLSGYAESFLFNRSIPFDLKLSKSKFSFPDNDLNLARSGAGFENSFISPLHAAMLAATFGNKGVTMKPYLVSEISNHLDGENTNGETYITEPSVIGRPILESTANEVMQMMEYTTTSGTARRFFKNFRATSQDAAIGKTGTLSGLYPEGRYHWFIGLAPRSNPEVAVAALVIDRGAPRVNGSGLARAFLDNYFSQKIE